MNKKNFLIECTIDIILKKICKQKFNLPVQDVICTLFWSPTLSENCEFFPEFVYLV